MKFLVFTDLHEDKKGLQDLISRASRDDIDFVICAGDISTFGRGLKFVLKRFNSIGKKFYFIPGNHEEGLDYAPILGDYSNVVDLHEQAIEIDSFVFLGFGGGGFAQRSPEFRKQARGWYGQYNGKKVVLVTHAPIFDTTTDDLNGQHVGSIDYRRFVERIKPKLVICGHLHETAGAKDKIGETKIVNPGWEGMVIELN